jgi:hypothetical protein
MRNLTSYLIFSAFALGIGLPGLVAAQTPVPKSPPKIELKWLLSLTLSPERHYVTPSRGGQVTGRVTLRRSAIRDTTINLSMTGALPSEESDPGIQTADGATIPRLMTIPDGESHGTFTISTSPGTGKRTKQFTVFATLGSESVSASFTVRTRLVP